MQYDGQMFLNVCKGTSTANIFLLRGFVLVGFYISTSLLAKLELND